MCSCHASLKRGEASNAGPATAELRHEHEVILRALAERRGGSSPAPVPVRRLLGPTDTRGARIKAYTDGRSVTVDYPHELNSEQAHFAAARAFAAKHFKHAPPTDRMVYGNSADGRGYVFCFPQSTIEA